MLTLLSACALPGLPGGPSYGPGDLAPGASEAEVLARLGPPSGRHRPPRMDGVSPEAVRRLEFARGPAGLHTWMVDLDAQGRVVGLSQVLEETHFLQLQPGMEREEVLRRLGRPGGLRELPRQQHQLWLYRYANPFCIVYSVSIDRQGRLAEAGHLPDPACERHQPAWHRGR